MPAEKVCQKCGANFWSVRGKRYCEQCRYVECIWCGARKLIAHPEQNEGRFCSRQCKVAWRVAHAPEVFWSYVDTTGECWEWQGGRHDYGYGIFSVGNGRDVYAHRYSWELANDVIPEGLSVLHRCDFPPCVRPDHLFVGTSHENTHDMLAKGRTPLVKTDYEIVCEIRERYRQGNIMQKTLAEEYEVSKSWVGYVVNNHIRLNN